MSTILKILFVVFLVWMVVGFTLVNQKHDQAEIVMGLGIFFVAFVFMPLFIYHRYKDGKYKKYIINDDKLREAFKNVGKN